MRARGIIALVMMVLGVFVIAFSIGSLVWNYLPSANIPILTAVGIVLFVVGVLLFIAEVLESWLTKGQTALVDGLQAG